MPSNNIILIGVFVLAGAFLLTYSLGAQLLNFGALIAFMGVNASAFTRYFLKNDRKRFWSFILPVLGFIICFYLWVSLDIKAQIVGICWLSSGVLYGAWRTSWFRKPLTYANIESD